MDPDYTPLLPQLQSYVGGSRDALAVPSLCISLPILKRNVDLFHKAVDRLGVSFRAHVKTHKTVEGTRICLGTKHSAVICSTIREIRGLKPLINEGIVTDVLYGLPPASSYIPLLSSLASSVTIRLLIDHTDQLKLLERQPPLSAGKWSVFIKLDMGTHRAGVTLESQMLKDLLTAIAHSNAFELYGFYCHAGHSYGGRSAEDALSYLKAEIDAATMAVDILRDMTGGDNPLVLSVGATPTAHALQNLELPKLKPNLRVEIHAGNFPFNDLQQLATGVVPKPDPVLKSSLAMTVNAEVISVYPDRNEALITAGTIALAREPGQYEGWARVRDNENWIVGRISQEHGILTTESQSEKVSETWEIGRRVVLNVQHACIAAAGHDWFFVVDQDDIVTDVWFPWRGWQ